MAAPIGPESPEARYLGPNRLAEHIGANSMMLSEVLRFAQSENDTLNCTKGVTDMTLALYDFDGLD